MNVRSLARVFIIIPVRYRHRHRERFKCAYLRARTTTTAQNSARRAREQTNFGNSRRKVGATCRGGRYGPPPLEQKATAASNSRSLAK